MLRQSIPRRPHPPRLQPRRHPGHRQLTRLANREPHDAAARRTRWSIWVANRRKPRFQRRSAAKRRGGDSNPRYGFDPVRRFSKPLPSAARPPLQRFQERRQAQRPAPLAYYTLPTRPVHMTRRRPAGPTMPARRDAGFGDISCYPRKTPSSAGGHDSATVCPPSNYDCVRPHRSATVNVRRASAARGVGASSAGSGSDHVDHLPATTRRHT